jgi:hypothetical protein
MALIGLPSTRVQLRKLQWMNLIAGVTVVGATSLAFALTLSLDGACSYFGEKLPAKAQTTAETGSARALVQRVLDVSGLARNFEIHGALVPNAAAVIMGQARYILYNPNFIDEIAVKTHNRWAAAAILAHEVGHHLNGHTLQPGGSRPALELEADYFSGFILQRLGAQLKDATAVLELYAPEHGDATHPGKKDRIASITAGWSEACKKDPDCFRDQTLPGDELNLDSIDQDSGKDSTTQERAQPGRRGSILHHLQ